MNENGIYGILVDSDRALPGSRLRKNPGYTACIDLVRFVIGTGDGLTDDNSPGSLADLVVSRKRGEVRACLLRRAALSMMVAGGTVYARAHSKLNTVILGCFL